MKSSTCYAAAALLLAIYAVNLLGGKLSGSVSAGGGWFMGEIGEFLCVLAAVTFFVAGFYRPARKT